MDNIVRRIDERNRVGRSLPDVKVFDKNAASGVQHARPQKERGKEGMEERVERQRDRGVAR